MCRYTCVRKPYSANGIKTVLRHTPIPTELWPILLIMPVSVIILMVRRFFWWMVSAIRFSDCAFCYCGGQLKASSKWEVLSHIPVLSYHSCLLVCYDKLVYPSENCPKAISVQKFRATISRMSYFEPSAIPGLLSFGYNVDNMSGYGVEPLISRSNEAISLLRVWQITSLCPLLGSSLDY
jgi:hypothetical protein